jgi:tRNA(fMet)-specific endonuclease VapC
MPGALLDTNAISDLMTDHPRIKARAAAYPGRLSTSVVAIGEIRYGVERLPAGKRRTDLEARARTTLANLLHRPVTLSVAETYGRLTALLESRGLNLQDNDLWIAATALTHSLILVTRDQIFTRIPGLVVEDWTV